MFTQSVRMEEFLSGCARDRYYLKIYEPAQYINRTNAFARQTRKRRWRRAMKKFTLFLTELYNFTQWVWVRCASQWWWWWWTMAGHDDWHWEADGLTAMSMPQHRARSHLPLIRLFNFHQQTMQIQLDVVDLSTAWRECTETADIWRRQCLPKWIDSHRAMAYVISDETSMAQYPRNWTDFLIDNESFLSQCLFH